MKGRVSDASEDRHSNVWLCPRPGDAALVELLVAGEVVALFVVAVPIEPAPVDAAALPVPDVVDAAFDADERPAEAGVPAENVATVVELDPVVAAPPVVELVAMLSIVAPRPALPAEAEPVDDPLPLEVEGGADTPTVGVLVSVAPEVTVDEAELPVLVRVWPDVA